MLSTSLLTQKPPPRQGTACFGGGFYYKYRYFSDYLTPFNINGLRCAWLFQSISWAYIFLFMIYIFRHIIPAESYTFRHMPTANTYTFQHVTVLQSYTFRHIRPNKHGEIRRQRSRLRLIFCDLPCPRSKKSPPRQGTTCLSGGFMCRGFCSFFLATFLPRLGKLPPICGFD